MATDLPPPQTLPLLFAADHPAFDGHFPGAPIVPGVLLLDAALHALATAGGAPVTGIAAAKFLQPVAPGEPLQLACTAGNPGRARFDVTGPDGPVATGQLLLGEPPPSPLP